MLYTSHKIHQLLKFIEIDDVYVNLTHKNDKSDWNQLQKFEEILTLHLMSQSMLS